MLKKVTVLLTIFTLVISFSMTAFASGATVSECNDSSCIVIENPAEPPADGYSDSGNGHGPNNPIHVAGD